MASKKTFSPTLFLVLEFCVLAPSIVFVLGILQYVFLQNNYILQLITPSESYLQGIFVTIISPLIGGFSAYQYLERYKPKGFVALKAKGIIFYTIMLVGLVICYNFVFNVL